MDAERNGDAADVVLRRAHDIAATPLEGINDVAEELAELAGTLDVITRARRAALLELDGAPTETNKQVVSLLRRAIELGEWDWETYEQDRTAG